MNDTLAWLRWSLVPGLGLKRSHQLLPLLDSPQALFLYPDRWPLPTSLRATLRAMSLQGEQHPVHQRALTQLAWAESEHCHLITKSDERYPHQFEVLDDPPLVLWARGDTSLMLKPQIAMVGSRAASANALRHARHLASELAENGCVITSGGAKGVDAACHQAALAAGGDTIAVLGSGVDVLYPAVNRQLLTNIAERGLLLSEYPLGTQPKPGHFPRRNRLISALAEKLVVIEAGLRSGTLVTAQHALDQGKDIYALPGDIGNPNTEGCHKLIQEGAYLLSGSHDLIDAPRHSSAMGSPSPPAALTEVQTQIVRALQSSEMPLDLLAHTLNLSIHQLLEPLLELELSGFIEQQPGGYCLTDVA